MPLTWGQIKALVEGQGVTDADYVFLVDIGPACQDVFVAVEELAAHVVPRGPQSARARASLANKRAVEIGDDPDLLLGNIPDADID